MKKKKIRCKKVYECVRANLYNYEIIIPDRIGWTHPILVTCRNCGELFVIDWENPATHNLNIFDIAGTQSCPTCNSNLGETIASYPQTIRISGGVFGSFTNLLKYGNAGGNDIIEFYELRPI